MMFVNYVKKQVNILLDVFDFKRFMYQLLVYLGGLLFIFLDWLFVKNKFDELNKQIRILGLDNMQEIQGSLISDTTLKSTLNSILYQIISYFLLMVAGIVLVWLFVEFITWIIASSNDMFKKGYKNVLKIFLKFFLLNLLWALIWALPIVFSSSLMVRGNAMGSVDPYTKLILYVVALFILGVFAFFTAILHYYFVQTTYVGKSIALTFSTGITKIRHFLLPIIFAIILSSLVGLLTRIVSFISFPVLTNLIYFVLFFSMIAWMKLYFAKIISKVQKKYPELAIDNKQSGKKKR